MCIMKLFTLIIVLINFFYASFGTILQTSNESVFSSDKTLISTTKLLYDSSSNSPQSPSEYVFDPEKPNVYAKNTTNDGIEVTCTTAFKTQVALLWMLNGLPLVEYDDLNEKTAAQGQISTVSIRSLKKLPTLSGDYTFSCNVLSDYDIRSSNLTLKVTLNNECQTDADCNSRGAICDKGQCKCDAATQAIPLNSIHVTCRLAAYLETPCSYTEQCVAVAENSECTEHGWCACVRGYGRNEEHQCEPKVGVYARCDSNEECADYEASCVLSHCTCYAKKRRVGDRCRTMPSSKFVTARSSLRTTPSYNLYHLIPHLMCIVVLLTK